MRFLIMPGARMVRSSSSDDWVFPYEVLSEDGKYTLAGGQSRMLAIREIFFRSAQTNVDIQVLTTGGIEQQAASRSHEAARQLVCVYGLPSSHVLSLGGSGTTKGNALAVGDFFSSIFRLPFPQIEIITNSYHALRSWIIFSDTLISSLFQEQVFFSDDSKKVISTLLDPTQDPDVVRLKVMEVLNPVFSKLPVLLRIQTVESVLLTSKDPSCRAYGQELQNHPLVFSTLVSEYQGIKAYIQRSYGK